MEEDSMERRTGKNTAPAALGIITSGCTLFPVPISLLLGAQL
jgi:hypothetical protein